MAKHWQTCANPDSWLAFVYFVEQCLRLFRLKVLFSPESRDWYLSRQTHTSRNTFYKISVLAAICCSIQQSFLPTSQTTRTELSTNAVRNLLSDELLKGQQDTVTEWLRWWTRNPLGFARRGFEIPLVSLDCEKVPWSDGWIEDVAHVAHNFFMQNLCLIWE